MSFAESTNQAKPKFLKMESQKNQLASKVLRESQFFGKSNWDDEYFNGEFDDIRIYDRAVTEAEVQALHAMGDVESVWEIPVDLKMNQAGMRVKIKKRLALKRGSFWRSMK